MKVLEDSDLINPRFICAVCGDDRPDDIHIETHGVILRYKPKVGVRWIQRVRVLG